MGRTIAKSPLQSVILSEAKNPAFGRETLRFAQGDRAKTLQSSCWGGVSLHLKRPSHEVIFMPASMMVAVWTCGKCGYENGPMRDVFCGNCGQRRPGW